MIRDRTLLPTIEHTPTGLILLRRQHLGNRTISTRRIPISIEEAREIVKAMAMKGKR